MREEKTKQKDICKPGETCDVAGWYPFGLKPEKIKSKVIFGIRFSSCKKAVVFNCKKYSLNDCSEDTPNIILDKAFFEKNTNWPNPFTGRNWLIPYSLLPQDLE